MAVQELTFDHVDDDARRRSIVATVLDRGGWATHIVPTEHGYEDVPVVEIDPACLVYRVDNGRILAELAAEAAREGRSVADLRDHAATPPVQALLHRLLVDKARDPEGPIYDELARHGRQTEPLLICRDGLVVNGNRRLAAMRALHAADPERYRNFAVVRAAVLPAETGPFELEFIEAALQMAPELKLAYGWINRRLKLRQHAHDLSREHVVAAYRFDDPGQIDRELAELALAEAYLRWIETPERYTDLADLEVHFRELRRQLDAIGPEHLRDVWRRLGFAMIAARASSAAAVTHYFPFTDPVPPAIRAWVPRALAEDRGLVARQAVGENKGIDATVAARLVSLLDDAGHAESTARAAIALIDTLKADPQRLLGVTRVMGQLRAARRAMQHLDADAFSRAQLRTLRSELAAIEAHVEAFAGRSNAPEPQRSRGLRGLRAGWRRWWRARWRR